LDGEVAITRTNATGPISEAHADPLSEFGRALALGRQPRTSLLALYQGWIDAILALEAAWITGRFMVAVSTAETAARRDALSEYARLEAEITRLRAKAEIETQLPRRVELNLEVKRLETEMGNSRDKLNLDAIQ
jgi:hypothetical protein